MDRQSLLCRDKPAVTCFIHEFALRLPVGGSRVMHDQCLKLLFETQRHLTTIRVIPAEIGAGRGRPG
jgi:hypothetical protein